MYQAENIRAVLAGRGRGVRGLWPRVNRTVLLLGVTSLLTDISSEMVATILPLYLVYTLGFTPLQFGVVDGLYQGAAALVRIASGLVGDRWSRHKEVAVARLRPLGDLQARCSWWSAAACRGDPGRDRPHRPHGQGHPHRPARRDDLAEHAAGRACAPRSACTARSTPRARCSARCWPSACWPCAPLAFDADLRRQLLLRGRRSGGAGAVRREPAARTTARPRRAASSLRAAGRLLRRARLPAPAHRRRRPRPGDDERRLPLPGACSARSTSTRATFPLLFVGTAAIFMLLAVPAGRLADRIGRGAVFLGGLRSAAAGVYVLLLGPSFGAARAGDLPGAARRVLRRDRRRPDGARQRDRARRTCAAAASRCS